MDVAENTGAESFVSAEMRPPPMGSSGAATVQLKSQSKYKNTLLGTCVALAVIGPQFALLWRPLFGVYSEAVALLLLFGIALWREQVRELALAAAVLPVAMMVNLSSPESDKLYQLGIFYNIIALFALTYGYLFVHDELPVRNAFAIKIWAVELPLMVVVGEVLGVLGYGMLRRHFQFNATQLPVVAVLAVALAAAEELYFRGLIQKHAAKALHPLLALLLTVVIYAAMSLGHGSLLPAGFACISGGVLSTIYYAKQNLILTTTANAVMKLTYLGLLATFTFR